MSYKNILAGLIIATTLSAAAQTRLKISSITPGTEQAQLVYNGDFTDTVTLNGIATPFGWNSQSGTRVSAGTNLTAVNSGSALCANVSGALSSSVCRRTVQLEPNTDYVLSAYLWNMGDAYNHVNTVIDFSDVPSEPQIVLSSGDSDADLGYFVYRSFNTGVTGSNINLRVFYDALTGTGAASHYFPNAAQWDNVAVTKASAFVPPQSTSTAGNIHPTVRIDSPSDAASIVLTSTPPSLPLTSSAADFDGTIANVAFYADGIKIGETKTSPYQAQWTNPVSGSHILSAIATDNQGATTVSAPVTIQLTAPEPPPFLKIGTAADSLQLSWTTSSIAVFLQSSPSLISTTAWKTLSNQPVQVSNEFRLTMTGSNQEQYFRLGPEVDPSTLNRKLMMGYQGWFACAKDGSPVNGWVHWFRGGSPTATNATVDFWPDISELDSDELYPTSMTLPNGAPARLYSAYNQKTVVRHFKWMKENHLDGVFLQRFCSELSSPAFFALRNKVTDNVRVGAETHGRVFAIMYDISDQSRTTLMSTVTNDWAYLVNTMHLTSSPYYVRHKGKPVVAVWGFGFTDRNFTPADAQALIAYFKSAGVTLMGGVPASWRTLNNDSQTNSAWLPVYRSFDIISPWAVGRYATQTEADNYKRNQVAPDLIDARVHNVEYMPVIFPGFSWHNLNAGPLNQIPRSGGTFYWRQVYNAVSAGCTMLYGAMFDEMDEGTAMLKMAPTSAQLPVQGQFVPLNIDGKTLPSDWYLRLAGEASKMLRGDIPVSPLIPIQP